MSSAVSDARPPAALTLVSNPLLKLVLRTRAGRRLSNLALIEFAGRRTGRRIAVVVGWHAVDGSPVIFTPAPWRANFAEGAAAIVWWRGRREERVGTLESEPVAVAHALDAVIRTGTSPRALGLRVPDGHAMTAADVTETGRSIVRFGPPLSDRRRATEAR